MQTGSMQGMDVVVCINRDQGLITPIYRRWPERFAWAYIHEMQHFVARVGGEDGRWAVATVLAGTKSMLEGRPVLLEEVLDGEGAERQHLRHRFAHLQGWASPLLAARGAHSRPWAKLSLWASRWKVMPCGRPDPRKFTGGGVGGEQRPTTRSSGSMPTPCMTQIYYPPNAPFWQMRAETAADLFVEELLYSLREIKDSPELVRAGFIKINGQRRRMMRSTHLLLRRRDDRQIIHQQSLSLLDLFAAAKDMFDCFDPYAQVTRELSSISKRDGRLEGHAKDPRTAGLSLDRLDKSPEICPIFRVLFNFHSLARDQRQIQF
ncbi:MAG: hypothetical protein IPM39_11115 [Chloroflexi bacterium]|nr:hypothetical protein [Chloroflexota bacterium]